MSSVATLLTGLPGCARLGPAALNVLAAACRAEELPAAARLVTEGEPAPDWYCVVQGGAVQVSRGNVDPGDILGYLRAGDVLDPGAPGSKAAWSASTVEPTRCLFIPQSVVARSRDSLAEPATHREDLTLFVRRVRDLLKGPPITCPSSASVGDAARLMTRRHVGSVIVTGTDGAPIGIVTDRDLRTKVLAQDLAASTSIVRIMSSPVIATEPERPAFDALVEMTRRGIHHLAVVGGARLHGVISSHDIILLQGAHPVVIGRDIESAATLDTLEVAASRIHTAVSWLAGQGVGAFDIGRIVAEFNDRLVRRALDLGVSRLDAEGHGRPPVPFAWLAAGSEGRREQTLKTDQDNGLVYGDPTPDLQATVATYFGRLAGTVGETLVRLGFPPCEGGFMASNPRWCQPDATWRQYFRSWMDTPEPEPLLRASIFFDLRVIAGDEQIGQRLWDWICESAPSQTLFLRYMAKAALDRHVPLGLFGGFVVERSGPHKDAVDLKARGVFPMTQAMRVYALSRGVRETNTVDRLLALSGHGLFTPTEAQELRDAYDVIARLRLRRQLACLDAGFAPDNFVKPDGLGRADRVLLKEAFKTLAWLQRGVEDRFLTDGIA